jgi:hypothetical protein
VQIGTPPQAVRLLPATGSQSIWAVLPIGCEQWEGSDCPYSRGYLFNYNKSSTWQQEDRYELPLSPEHYLPYSGNADFGFDNITVNCAIVEFLEGANSSFFSLTGKVMAAFH